ncbi:MAG: serine/threonine protein kinase [Gloeocapsa sp. DLM2.Bin57]|nr:MAG: serine/threonine protein kinase [Gloeocapsa sp. DLM2.Bin57]
MITQLLNNRYRIVQTIGRGGFGETFIATDTHMPSERKCVIKQLKPAIQPPETWVKERFQREAAILEELGEHSPQIPRLYAYFAEGSDFYLVQELIPGINLRQKIAADGVLTPKEVTDLLLKLLPVLEYTHNHKIIHRDIKPENIILREKDNLPVLIDFGALKEAIITQANPQANSVSISIGTPGYMSSEQAAGRPVYSSDLYSLGLTAIYLLTGKSPQELPVDSQTGEILWREEAPQIHSNLASVIDRSIRFHPRDRFQNASEMLKALNPENAVLESDTHVVAPVYNSSKQEIPTGSTVVLNHPYLKESGNNPLKMILWLLLLGAGVTLGAIALLISLIIPRPQDRPAVTPDVEDTSTPVITLPPLEPHQQGDLEPFAEAIPIPEEVAEVPEAEPPVIETPREPIAPEDTPIFTLGTTQQDIAANLGKPTSQYRGYHDKTIVWAYRDLSPGVEVRYTFNTENEELRQSEAIFNEGTSLEIIAETLNLLLGGEAPNSISSALEAVYRNQTDLRSFTYQDQRGMIRRDNRQKIKIIISASDFN